MSAHNLTASAAFTFHAEGDDVVSRDPNDGGNWSSGTAGRGVLIGTKYGVAAPTLISWLAPQNVTPATMTALTQITATSIFAARYWQSANCDAMPNGLDLMVCDMGFNAGDATSVRILQRKIGLTGDDVDGWCGPGTINAISDAPVRGMLAELSNAAAKAVQLHIGVTADGDIGQQSLSAIEARTDQTFVLCAALADAQLSYYRSLEDWSLYGKGWGDRVWARLAAALHLTH